MTQVLIETVKDGVLTLTMNRPDRLNALNPEMLAGLHDALMRAAVDREIAVIVLAGAGRAFCAGGDVKAMAEGGRSETVDERAQSLRQRMEAGEHLGIESVEPVRPVHRQRQHAVLDALQKHVVHFLLHTSPLAMAASHSGGMRCSQNSSSSTCRSLRLSPKSKPDGTR